MFSRAIRAVLLLLVAVSIALPLSAQITEIRQEKGETIYCTRSGLHGFSDACGADSGYEYVFIGSVISVANGPDDEQRVQLAPEEVFFGNPGKEVIAITNQRRCIAELHPRDRWLVYLYYHREKKEFLLSYGSGSVPVADAEIGIARLRRLSGMAGMALIRGHVQQAFQIPDGEQYEDVSNHKLIATRKDTGAHYTVFTDDQGAYEFEPLPSGSYELTANTTAGWWAEEGRVDIHARDCRYVGFQLVPDSSISGRVRAVGADPEKVIWVEAVKVGGEESHSTFADKDGHFEFRGLRPGKYLIGVDINAQPGTPEWKHRLYYPGVRQKDLAIIIDIGRGEQRSNIEFALPAH